MIIKCDKCSKEFNRKPSHIKKQNFCSVKCLSTGYKYTDEQRKNWADKARLQKGAKRSPEACKNIGLGKKGKKHPNWKGDKVSYVGLHCWVNSNWIKEKKCEVCDQTDQKFYDWANLGIYNRERKNWKVMCRSCHNKSHNKAKHLEEFNKKKQIEIKVRNPKIIKMYKEGIKVKDIAKEFKLTSVTIYSVIK